MDIENIISRLQEIGLTQTEIGVSIGCSQEAVSLMANGKIGKTRPAWKVVEGLRLLAEKHGLTIAQPETTTPDPLPCNLPDDSNVRETTGPVGRMPPNVTKEMT